MAPELILIEVDGKGQFVVDTVDSTFNIYSESDSFLLLLPLWFKPHSLIGVILQ